MSATADTNLELLVQDPGEVARRMAEQMIRLSRSDTGEELVYSPTGPHSYYRDLLARETGRVASPGFRDRLEQHGEQMVHVHEARARRVRQLEASGMFEFRTTPDRTDGTGGYFSPPAWLNELFATANRPGRVLAGLMNRFPLPPGVSTVNVPVIGTGTLVAPAADDAATTDQDITDSSAASAVVPFAGTADVALQLLEQSPAGAHVDWAIFMDLSEAYDFDLETQLLTGNDNSSNPATAQLPGVLNVANIITVPYTSGSPTGSGMWTPLSKVPAQIGDARGLPPQCWLMRTARWCWLQGAEDVTNQRPFGLSTRFYIGNDDNTPDPISGMMGWPVFLNDAIPATLGGAGGLNVGAGTQDTIICLRPRDQHLLEGEPQTLIAREPLSGAMGVRIQMHCNVAAITGKRPASIGVLQGTGLTVQSGY